MSTRVISVWRFWRVTRGQWSLRERLRPLPSLLVRGEYIFRGGR